MVVGKDYALGGTEFYNKLLECNMALPSLMGPNGKKYYTAHGNDVRLHGIKVHLTVRRQNLIVYFKKYVEEAKAKGDHSEELKDLAAELKDSAVEL